MEIFFLALLLILLILALASGFPVAFSLPGSAIITIGLAALSGSFFAGDESAYFAHGGPDQWLNAAITNFRGIYFEVERDTLIAIPLFVFMGIMLQRSKIAEDLLVAMAQLFGPVPGGLGIAVVFVGALLAATTGIVGATVIAMGLISLPVMLRNKYNVPLATGTIAASGTLGQIIPPSIVLIILADQLSSATDRAATLRKTEYKEATGSFSMPTEFNLTSTSAGEMFLGALLPGLVLVGLYMLYILIIALTKPKSAPPVPYEGVYDRDFIKRVLLALVPPLALIFMVLGSIVMGIATVNQAGAIGAIGAMVMAGYRLMEGKHAFIPAILALISLFIIGLLMNNFNINLKAADSTKDYFVVFIALVAVLIFLSSIVWTGWRTYKIENTLRDVMIETAKTTSLVFIILIGAAMLTAAFRAFGGEELVRDFLTGLPGGFITKFLVVMFVIFLLGFFLDFIEIAVVVVPIIAPILLADTSANVTGVWLGVMIGVNMQTSFLTPPFGFALFYLRGVAPKIVRTIQMYKGVIPFILLQLAGLGIVGVYPSLVNYLPNRVSLTSETAPPPRNPRLQLCIEEMLFPQYDLENLIINESINKARLLDLSYVPEGVRTKLLNAFNSAANTFSLVNNVRQAEQEVAKFTPGYKPLHRKVRAIQRKILRLEKKIKKSKEALNRASFNEAENYKQKIDELSAEISILKEKIPKNWNKVNQNYKKLDNLEKRVRIEYRNNADNAYMAIVDVIAIINDLPKLRSLKDKIFDLKKIIDNKNSIESKKAIKEVERLITSIKGTNLIKSILVKARKSLSEKKTNTSNTIKELDKALHLYAQELKWREQAKTNLVQELGKYEKTIRNTIGLRMQERLNSEQAKIIASCKAVHRDISLSF